MTFSAFVNLVTQHWVLIALVACPVVVIMMALAALTCEACGAPFGVFRRRQRTIDLCLRCAMLHDFRRASEIRKSAAQAASSEHGASGKDSPDSHQDDRATQRRFAIESPVELGLTAHPIRR
jgi:hypothetical protein